MQDRLIAFQAHSFLMKNHCVIYISVSNENFLFNIFSLFERRRGIKKKTSLGISDRDLWCTIESGPLMGV